MRILTISLLALALLAPCGARAEEEDLSAQFRQCLEADLDNAGMIQCCDREQEKQDARLNNAYKAVLKRLDSARAEKFKQIQRQWWQAREGSTLFMGEGGSMYSTASAVWRVRFTAERAGWMERQAERLESME